MECIEDIWCGRKLFNEDKAFYMAANLSIRVNREINKNFGIERCVRHGCVSWCNKMDGILR